VISLTLLSAISKAHHEVANDIVPRPLSEESHTGDHAEAVACCSSVDQFTEVPPRICAFVAFGVLAYFTVLELDHSGVDVSIGMVLGEDVQSLLVATLIICQSRKQNGSQQVLTCEMSHLGLSGKNGTQIITTAGRKH